jgi:very-long-chain enoyl-CoA reductase
MSTSEVQQTKSAPLVLGQRLHNTVSYLGAALVMAALVQWEKAAAAPVAALWIFHFLRRAAESSWVHRFSGKPIRPSEYLVEYLYYWGFATWVALGISASTWSPVMPALFTGGLLIFVVGELGNTWAHLALRKLRSSSGSTEKAIPQGGLFSLVSCPHYLFEITSWIGFAVLSWTWGSLAFLGLGSAILASYASSRHRSYRETFDGKDGRALYPARRRALIPFIF